MLCTIVLFYRYSDVRYRRQRTISRESQPRPLKLEYPKVPQLVVNVSAHINIIVQVPTGTRTSLLVVPVDPFSTIGRIKEMICYKEKLSGKDHRLQQGATLFYEFDILQGMTSSTCLLGEH